MPHAKKTNHAPLPISEDEAVLGRILKNAREANRLSPEEWSRETKIPIHYIHAIEGDCFAKLPPDVYVKGMLKAYASRFQLDDAKLFPMFETMRQGRVSGASDELPKNRFAFSFRPLFPRAHWHPAWLFALAALTYLFLEARPFLLAPRIIFDEPLPQFAATTSPVTVEGRAIGARTLTLNGKSVDLLSRGAFRVDLPLTEGLNSIEVVAENYLRKETRLVRYVVLQKPAPAARETPGHTPSETPQEEISPTPFQPLITF